jgi:hypothetical protein
MVLLLIRREVMAKILVVMVVNLQWEARQEAMRQ